MPVKKKDAVKYLYNGTDWENESNGTDWGEVISVDIFELPKKNNQAYDVGVFCLNCGGTILTSVVRWDGELHMKLPENCPICLGKECSC